MSSPSRGEQLFSELKGPAAVVNAFPTGSYTAWTGLLEPFGVETPPGYIGQYFDRDEMRVRGVSIPQKNAHRGGSSSTGVCTAQFRSSSSTERLSRAVNAKSRKRSKLSQNLTLISSRFISSRPMHSRIWKDRRVRKSFYRHSTRNWMHCVIDIESGGMRRRP